MTKQTENPTAAPPATPAELGMLLRDLREQKQLSIGEVSERLKLPARQIEALENGGYDDLPEPIFVRGFLRSYGRFLGADDAVLSAALERIAPTEKVANTANCNNNKLNFAEAERKKPFPTWIFGLIAVPLIGYGVYAWQTKSKTENARQEAESKPLPTASEASRPTLDNPNVVVKPMTASDTQTVSASSASQPAATGELVINARYRTMLTVTNAKGEILINQIVPARSEHRFQDGAPFEIRLGYAVGSTVTFNGQELDVNAARKGGKTATLTTGSPASAAQ